MSAWRCSSVRCRSAKMWRDRSVSPSGRSRMPGLDVERLRRDAQGLGDLLEDLGRRPAQTPLDLAQVGVGDPGQLGQASQRQAGRAALLPDERAQFVEALRQLLDEPVAVVADRVGHDRRPSTEARPGLVALDQFGLEGVDPLVQAAALGRHPDLEVAQPAGQVGQLGVVELGQTGDVVGAQDVVELGGQLRPSRRCPASTGRGCGPVRRPARDRPGCRPGCRPRSTGRGRPSPPGRSM